MKLNWVKVLKQLQILFVIIIINPVFVLTILLTILLTLPFRSLVWLLSKIFRPDLSGFVPPDQACFALGSAHNFPFNITACAIVEGNLELDYFWKIIPERILSLKSPTGQSVYIGLRRYWTLFLGYAFWKEDGAFSIKNHVRLYDYIGVLAARYPCVETDLQRIIGGLLKQPWVPNRSPWEVLLIPKYKGLEKTALIIRLDHVLADGFSVIELMRHLTQSHWPLPNFKLALPNPPIFKSLGAFLKLQYDVAEKAVIFYGTKKIPSLKRSSGNVQVVFCFTPEISVDEIKRLKNHFEVNYAAVINSCIFGAIERALNKADQIVPRKCLTSVVIPKLNHPGGLCIHAGVTFAEWRLKSASAVQRLLRTQKGLENLMQSFANMVYVEAGKVAGFVPQCLTVLVFSGINTSGVNVGTTALPVTTGKNYINGMELSELIVGNGIVGEIDMLVTSCGVNNKQRVSFSVNKHMFGSEDIASNLAKFFLEEFQALLDAMQPQ